MKTLQQSFNQYEEAAYFFRLSVALHLGFIYIKIILTNNARSCFQGNTVAESILLICLQ